jgi:riboflavin biosynthesis pyrimidine reductase
MKIRTLAVGALLTATSVAAGLGIPTASADDPTPTVNSCSSGPETKPSEMTIICDNTLRVDKITWSSWNAIRASGRGIQFLVVCEPNCVTGTPIYTPVAITLEGASAPDFRFTSATITSLTTGEVHSYPLGG